MPSGPGHQVWDFPALSSFTATENSLKSSPRGISFKPGTVLDPGRAVLSRSVRSALVTHSVQILRRPDSYLGGGYDDGLVTSPL